MYFADESGAIWTTKRKGGNDRASNQEGAPYQLTQHKNKSGYLQVNLLVHGIEFSRRVHTLVLETFVGPKPDGMECCHYPDSNKENNNLNNLRWDTHSENAKDKYRDCGEVNAKQCKTCLQTKHLTEFYKDKRSSDGVKTECKPCHISTAKQTRDPEKKRIANREYMRRTRSLAA